MIVRKYKVWYDRKKKELVTYNPHWTAEERKHLELIGELQPNQNPFMMDDRGIYRELYGKKKYYKGE